MEKEKATKDVNLRIQPSLYQKFTKICNKNYKKKSEVIRELMLKYIEENNV